jgi:hypothetical protein
LQKAAYLKLCLASTKKTLPIEALNDAGCQVLLLDRDFELKEGDELKLGLVTKVVVRAAH